MFILDARGKTLIARDFRGDLPLSNITEFKKRVIDSDHVGSYAQRVHCCLLMI